MLQMFITNLQKVNIRFYEISFRNVEIKNIEKRVLEIIQILERYEIYTGENTWEVAFIEVTIYKLLLLKFWSYTVVTIQGL